VLAPNYKGGQLQKQYQEENFNEVSLCEDSHKQVYAK